MKTHGVWDYADTWASLGDDISRSEDTWASEDTLSEHCPGQDTCRERVRRYLPKTGRAKARVVAKTRGRAKTLPEDKSGEDTRVHAGTSRAQVGRTEDSRVGFLGGLEVTNSRGKGQENWVWRT